MAAGALSVLMMARFMGSPDIRGEGRYCDERNRG
jgi:hypothetical protein